MHIESICIIYSNAIYSYKNSQEPATYLKLSNPFNIVCEHWHNKMTIVWIHGDR